MNINHLMGELRSLTQRPLTQADWQALNALVSTIEAPQHMEEVALYLKDTLLAKHTAPTHRPWGLWCATTYTLVDYHIGDGWWEYCDMAFDGDVPSLIHGDDHFVDRVDALFDVADRITWHATGQGVLECLEIREDASYKTHTLSWPGLHMELDDAQSWGDAFDYSDPEAVDIPQNPFALSDQNHPFIHQAELPYAALERMRRATTPGHLRPMEFGRKFTKSSKNIGRDLWPEDHPNLIAHKMGDFYPDTMSSEIQHSESFRDVFPDALIDHIVDVFHFSKQENAPLQRALYFGDFTFTDGEATPSIYVYTVTYQRASAWSS